MGSLFTHTLSHLDSDAHKRPPRTRPGAVAVSEEKVVCHQELCTRQPDPPNQSVFSRTRACTAVMVGLSKNECRKSLLGSDYGETRVGESDIRSTRELVVLFRLKVVRGLGGVHEGPDGEDDEHKRQPVRVQRLVAGRGCVRVVELGVDLAGERFRGYGSVPTLLEG